jgi:hypothetical protein
VRMTGGRRLISAIQTFVSSKYFNQNTYESAASVAWPARERSRLP